MATFNMITVLVTLTYDTSLIYLDFCTTKTTAAATVVVVDTTYDTIHIVKVINNSIS